MDEYPDNYECDGQMDVWEWITDKEAEEMEQESMIFYRSFYEALRDLDDSIRLELYDAIMRYSLYEEEVNLSAQAKPFFRLISPQLDANLRRRKNGMLGKEYGVLGGRPKKGDGDTKKNPIGVNKKTPKGLRRETPNINVNVNKNVNNNIYKRKKNTFTDYKQSETDYESMSKKIYAN